MMQLAVILSARIVLHGETGQDICNAYKTTVSERHWATYVQYLTSLCEAAEEAALQGLHQHLSLWADQAQAVWNLL